MIKNYLERRKALQKAFMEICEKRLLLDGETALRIHRELVSPFRVLLVTVCVIALICVLKS